jgi:hypothetical protein
LLVEADEKWGGFVHEKEKKIKKGYRVNTKPRCPIKAP